MHVGFLFWAFTASWRPELFAWHCSLSLFRCIDRCTWQWLGSCSSHAFRSCLFCKALASLPSSPTDPSSPHCSSWWGSRCLACPSSWCSHGWVWAGAWQSLFTSQPWLSYWLEMGSWSPWRLRVDGSWGLNRPCVRPLETKCGSCRRKCAWVSCVRRNRTTLPAASSSWIRGGWTARGRPCSMELLLLNESTCCV